MKNPNRKRLLALTAAAACQGLFAQTAPAPAPAETEAEEEVIQLTPFEINATQDRGYAATQTLAGTRIRTDLRDVGAAISVVTLG